MRQPKARSRDLHNVRAYTYAVMLFLSAPLALRQLTAGSHQPTFRVIRHTVANIGSKRYDFWEDWKVEPDSSDSTFSDIIGANGTLRGQSMTVRGSVRFYEGLSWIRRCSIVVTNLKSRLVYLLRRITRILIFDDEKRDACRCPVMEVRWA